MGGWTCMRRAALCAGLGLIAACTVQLVAPYDAQLQQQASAMQAQVGTWDLSMRAAAGTINADPRNPDVISTLNAWRGDADAMLTLAISNDTGLVSCGDAVKAVSGAIEAAIPAGLKSATPPATTGAGTPPPAGCESDLVATIATGIDDVQKALKYCQASWVPDSYFATLAQTKGAAPAPPAAPSAAQQTALQKSCLAEFKAQTQTPANAAEAGHGRAVSALLTSLQTIVYIETRKKAATTTTAK